MAKPLVLLSSARSGTNYVLGVIKAMRPDAIVLREVFRKGSDSLDEMSEITGASPQALMRLAETDPAALWQTLRSVATRTGRPLALKVFYYHAPESSPLWTRITDEARVVHLLRRRFLDAFVSRKLAEETGQWLRTTHPDLFGSADALTLAPDEIEAFVKLRSKQIKRFRQRFAGADLVELYYEDLAGSPSECAKTLARVTTLGPAQGPLTIKLKKQNTRPLRDIVRNYNEIAAYDRDYLTEPYP